MFNKEWALKSCFNQVQQNFGCLCKRAKLKKKKKKQEKYGETILFLIQDTISGFGSQPWLWTEIKGGGFFLIRTKSKVLEKEMATHFSILAWRITWTEEPGRLQSMGSQQLDTTQWLTCSQSLVETSTEIQIVGSRGGVETKGAKHH